MFLCLVLPSIILPAAYAARAADAKGLAVAIVVSGENREYRQVYTAIKERLESTVDHQVILKPYLSDNYTVNHSNTKNRPDLIVTIGTAAASKVAVTGGVTPVLSAFLPKSSYESIWKDKDRPVSGIVIDQPISRYTALLGLLFNKGDKVGIFNNKGDVAYKKLIPLLRPTGLSLVAEDVYGSLSAKDISRLLSATDLIFVNPDFKYISPQRAKWLLYMAYRDAKPVIAFTPSYVKAGALAAIYSSPEAIGMQTAKIISTFLVSPAQVANAIRRMKSIIYPDNFYIATNKQVAIHTGIRLPDEKRLEHLIRSGERHVD